MGAPPCTTTTLVTGASRGLGLSLVREILRNSLVGEPTSVRVLLTARTAAAAHGAASALQREMGIGLETVCGCELDVSNRRSVEAFLREHGDCIDLVINNAAVRPTGWNAATTRECWRINVLGPLVLSRALLPGMLRRRRGHILHVSSGDGELVYLHTAFEAALRKAASERAVLRVLARAAPPRNAFGHAPAHGPTPAYAASKAALNALTRIGASQLPKADTCGVCISAVCPGDVNTRMLSIHDPQARLRALPPAVAARGVLRVAACGLDPAANAFPSGRFWRHSQEIDF